MISCCAGDHEHFLRQTPEILLFGVFSVAFVCFVFAGNPRMTPGLVTTHTGSCAKTLASAEWTSPCYGDLWIHSTPRITMRETTKTEVKPASKRLDLVLLSS